MGSMGCYQACYSTRAKWCCLLFSFLGTSSYAGHRTPAIRCQTCELSSVLGTLGNTEVYAQYEAKQMPPQQVFLHITLPWRTGLSWRPGHVVSWWTTWSWSQWRTCVVIIPCLASWTGLSPTLTLQLKIYDYRHNLSNSDNNHITKESNNNQILYYNTSRRRIVHASASQQVWSHVPPMIIM